MPRFSISLLMAAMLVSSASADRYWVEMRDGEIQSGNELRYLDDPNREVELDGKNLLQIKHPVRTLRDTALSTAQPQDHLELVNGDILAGRVVEAVTGERAAPLPDHLVVGDVPHNSSLRVRLDWVRRIASTGQARFDVAPSSLRLKDGRTLPCRSIRWEKSGLKALTGDGVTSVGFDQIAELQLSQAATWMPLYPGAVWLADEPPAVVRTATVDGQAFTYPRSMVTKEFEIQRGRKKSSSGPELFGCRPPWSIDLLLVERDAIAWQSYFDDGEAPLSLLPAVAVTQRSGLHHHPWRRNRNVYGGLLQCGQVVSELGVGMHAYSRLTFQLPPRAKSFSTRVGLDRRVGSGGCVHCRIWRDKPGGAPLWERKFLTGADGLQQVGPLDLDGAKQLILEVDFAHENRPQGADPLDIRDAVDWLMPIVRFEAAKDNMPHFAQALPEIEGWTISAEQLKQIKLRPYWVKRPSRLGMAIVTGKEPLVLSQKVHVSLENSWLQVKAACEKSGGTRTISVRADGERVGSTMNGDLGTHDRYQFGSRVHILRNHAGKTRTIDVVADAHKRSRGELAGVVWDWLRLQPLVRQLPSGGEPIRPDVPLTSLKPSMVHCRQQPLTLLPGKLTTGGALNVRDWQFDDGYGVPTGTDITYRLDPAWDSFVAVIGLADGWHGAGPYQILLDGKLHWSSQQTYARNDQGAQISVSIPPGHSTITLRILGKESGGAWAHAGFLK